MKYDNKTRERKLLRTPEIAQKPVEIISQQPIKNEIIVNPKATSNNINEKW